MVWPKRPPLRLADSLVSPASPYTAIGYTSYPKPECNNLTQSRRSRTCVYVCVCARCRKKCVWETHSPLLMGPPTAASLPYNVHLPSSSPSPMHLRIQRHPPPSHQQIVSLPRIVYRRRVLHKKSFNFHENEGKKTHDTRVHDWPWKIIHTHIHTVRIYTHTHTHVKQLHS